MQKTILLTGATDGIGLETARMLVAEGHRVLLHGRNRQKLENVEQALSEVTGDGQVESYVADLSRMAQVEALAKAVIEKHDKLDVLINNAGIFKTPEPVTADGLDVRFAVNPGSLLGTKMVKEAFGAGQRDIRVGAEILVRAALSEEFEAASGQYFDNDSGRFAAPHADALDPRKSDAVVRAIETILSSNG